MFEQVIIMKHKLFKLAVTSITFLNKYLVLFGVSISTITEKNLMYSYKYESPHPITFSFLLGKKLQSQTHQRGTLQ